MKSRNGERGKILGMLWGFSLKDFSDKHGLVQEMENAITHYVGKYKDNPITIEISERFKKITEEEINAFVKYANLSKIIRSKYLKPNEIIIWGALDKKN